MYKFVIGLLNFITQILFPYKLIGKEKVVKGEACVLVGNHHRIWDIVHMARTTKDRVHFIAKAELFKKPIIGGAARKIEAIPVERDGKDVKAVMTSLKYLKRGEKISMFPEGTRNRGKEELLPLKGGAALFAIRAKAPVYPVMTNGKTKLFRRNKILVGEPVDLAEFYDKKMTPEDYEVAEERIRTAMLNVLHDLQQNYGRKKKKK